MVRLTAFFVIIFLNSLVPGVVAQQVEVHDPVMAQEGGYYYVFSTGPGITIYQSEDMTSWRWVGRVFDKEPEWARATVPGFEGHLWAPDILHHKGRFYLYYSVSAFGKNTSAIGVATNKTLNPNAEDYEWVDKGIVLQSVPERDHWNAIDAAVIEDPQGNVWMSFGSFWEGIKLVKLDASLEKPAEPQQWFSLARRPASALTSANDPGAGAVEAPFLFRSNGWYYLFVSFDKCCRGLDSDYKIMVGRSRNIGGPYLDKEGVPMLEGGGSLLLEGNSEWVALGHNGVYRIDDQDWLVFHAYETADNGKQKLKILPLSWKDGWPTIARGALAGYSSALIGAAPPENR